MQCAHHQDRQVRHGCKPYMRTDFAGAGGNLTCLLPKGSKRLCLRGGLRGRGAKTAAKKYCRRRAQDWRQTTTASPMLHFQSEPAVSAESEPSGRQGDIRLLD